jgi:hypothetical protein
MVDTPELAAEIIAALNGAAPNDREWIANALGREANRIYQQQGQDFPSNVLDAVSWNLRMGETEFLSERKHPGGLGIEPTATPPAIPLGEPACETCGGLRTVITGVGVSAEVPGVSTSPCPTCRPTSTGRAPTAEPACTCEVFTQDDRSCPKHQGSAYRAWLARGSTGRACEAWCGKPGDGWAKGGGVREVFWHPSLGQDSSFAPTYCTAACRDAGRPLNPEAPTKEKP